MSDEKARGAVAPATTPLAPMPPGRFLAAHSPRPLDRADSRSLSGPAPSPSQPAPAATRREERFPVAFHHPTKERKPTRMLTASGPVTYKVGAICRGPGPATPDPERNAGTSAYVYHVLLQPIGKSNQGFHRVFPEPAACRPRKDRTSGDGRSMQSDSQDAGPGPGKPRRVWPGGPRGSNPLAGAVHLPHPAVEPYPNGDRPWY